MISVQETLTEIIKDIPGKYCPYRDIHHPETGEVLYFFDEESAQKAIDFIEECCHFTGGDWGGRPMILERWQKAIVANMFGWKCYATNPETGEHNRRYREVFIYVPRKNGKTELLAAIALYVFFCDGENAVEIHSAASTLKQAKIVFTASKRMIWEEPLLEDMCEMAVASVTMPHPHNSIYEPVCANAKSLNGLKTHLALIDELHAHDDNGALVAILTSATKCRSQPLMVYTTTADHDRESICNTIYKLMCKVRDGDERLDDHLPVIYEALITDDWLDEKIWRKANPNYGISVIEENFKKELKKAKAMPSYENEFKRLSLNMRTQQANRWISLPAWDGCCDPFDRQEMIKKLKGHRCYAGLDLSQTIDTSCFVLIFPDDDFVVLPFFWVPNLGAIEKEKKDKVKYSLWEKQGFIEKTSGARIDNQRIINKVVELNEMFKIEMVAFDRYGATDVYNVLTEQHGMTLFMHGQGYKSMDVPTKRLEMAITNGTINHGHNPVMRWMIGNVMVKEAHTGSIYIDKGASSEKVDGPVALVMAYNCHIIKEVEKTSHYNRSELRVL